MTGDNTLPIDGAMIVQRGTVEHSSPATGTLVMLKGKIQGLVFPYDPNLKAGDEVNIVTRVVKTLDRVCKD